MISDMVPAVREALAVSSSYDAVTIPSGIRRAIAFLLRGWTFPKSLVRISPVVEGNSATLPATGVGKIHAVRLRTTENGTALYKRLRKGLHGDLPTDGGPNFYQQEGASIVLDAAVDSAAYNLDIWYTNTDPTVAEPWITTEFEDILFTLAVLQLAQELRKPEVQATFAPIWQQHIPTLAQYLNEVEFNDLGITMEREGTNVAVPRYGV